MSLSNNTFICLSNFFPVNRRIPLLFSVNGNVVDGRDVMRDGVGFTKRVSGEMKVVVI